MRRTSCKTALLPLAAVICALVATSAQAATQYRITGRGWGHGIGMSQYGAQGFAQHGYTAPQVVAWYFQGTAIGAPPADATNIRIQLVGGRPAVSFGIDAAGVQAQHEGVALAVPLQVGDTVIARVEGGLTSVFVSRAGSETRLFGPDALGTTLSGPDGAIKTLFRADNGSSNHHYRGTQTIVSTSGSIAVVNTVAMESYLRGVVPSEMPATWLPAALQAQAIAARSYAIAQRKTGGSYDAYPDTRSQMYLGIEHEQASTDAAVAATAGQVLTYGGAVIPAFFFSTSGGQTANNEDVWPGPARPYLRSRPDPYEASPYTTWPETIVLTPREVGAKLGLGRDALAVRVAVNPSQRAASVAVDSSGGTTIFTPASFQVRFGLRSTWFRVEQLTILPRVARPLTGTRFRLTGITARGGATYVTVRDPGSTTWVRVARIRPGAGGAWQLRVGMPKGLRSRDFRLERNGLPGPAIRVRARLR